MNQLFNLFESEWFENLNTKMVGGIMKGKDLRVKNTNTVNHKGRNNLEGTVYCNHAEVNSLIDLINQILRTEGGGMKSLILCN